MCQITIQIRIYEVLIEVSVCECLSSHFWVLEFDHELKLASAMLRVAWTIYSYVVHLYVVPTTG